MPNRTTGAASRSRFPRAMPMPKVSRKPCSPDGVTITAWLRFILSIQPRSKHRFVSAAPTAPAMCGRRSVQSRHSRQKWRRVELERGKLDPELGEKSGARRRDFGGLVVDHDVFMRDQRIGEINAETTRKVVVADSGRTQRACLTGEGAVSRPLFERDGDDPVDHLYHLRRRKPEIPMPPLSDRRQQARLGQLREMRAGGLRRDSRRKGKLARGQGAAIEKRRHHGGSRRFPDQRCDLGDDRAGNHVSEYRTGNGR